MRRREDAGKCRAPAYGTECGGLCTADTRRRKRGGTRFPSASWVGQRQAKATGGGEGTFEATVSDGQSKAREDRLPFCALLPRPIWACR